ncbi:MAG TPA: hypothetical protein VHG92_02815 [Afifellaceae bacterium]|nr:hypothetical protein [Afifellaceae bacterium]
MKPLPPRFTAADADRAHDEWGANCGPGAIAAICGLTLDELRPHMGDFEAKRYTNPTLMWAVLRSLGVRWRLVRPPRTWPRYGLARVQWEGPWTEPGVPIAARYRQTHWVGACTAGPGAGANVGIFDINAIGNGSGWCSLENWAGRIVPLLTGEIPRASGRWHLTHVVEVSRDG